MLLVKNTCYKKPRGNSDFFQTDKNIFLCFYWFLQVTIKLSLSVKINFEVENYSYDFKTEQKK